ncbi:MAG TPA: PASTA domain-containing protein [Candidatus Angelobacter sp.]
MRAIFISYRRNDSEGEAGRLYDDLIRQFSEASVFMDVAAIEVGRDFRKAIDQSVATCGVLLALIGKNWIEARNEDGQRRLDDPADFVRLELAAALKRDIPVIPVLVQGARMPRAEQLPDSLKELAYRNGVELTHPRWASDLQLLIKALRPYVEDSKSEAAPVGIEVAQPTRVPAAHEEPSKLVHRKAWWKSRGAILTFFLIAVLAVAAYIFWPKQVKVPDVAGNNLSDATARLQAAHLVLGHVTYEVSSSKDPDTVLSQSPSANLNVKSGTAVNLVLAGQPATVEIPPLNGKPLDVAQRALDERHLSVGQISREPRSDVKQNIVVDEFPKSGKKVSVGSAIDLVVAVAAVASDKPASPSPSPPVPQPKFPDFGGTWGMTKLTINGVTLQNAPRKQITIVQKGDLLVLDFSLQLKITPAGDATLRELYAADGQKGRLVATEEEADFVATRTLTVRDSILSYTETHNYRKPYMNHPQGTDVAIGIYRRISP